jgi:hypothetical protein
VAEREDVMDLGARAAIVTGASQVRERSRLGWSKPASSCLARGAKTPRERGGAGTARDAQASGSSRLLRTSRSATTVRRSSIGHGAPCRSWRCRQQRRRLRSHRADRGRGLGRGRRRSASTSSALSQSRAMIPPLRQRGMARSSTCSWWRHEPVAALQRLRSLEGSGGAPHETMAEELQDAHVDGTPSRPARSTRASRRGAAAARPERVRPYARALKQRRGRDAAEKERSSRRSWPLRERRHHGPAERGLDDCPAARPPRGAGAQRALRCAASRRKTAGFRLMRVAIVGCGPIGRSGAGAGEDARLAAVDGPRAQKPLPLTLLRRGTEYEAAVGRDDGSRDRRRRMTV